MAYESMEEMDEMDESDPSSGGGGEVGGALRWRRNVPWRLSHTKRCSALEKMGTVPSKSSAMVDGDVDAST